MSTLPGESGGNPVQRFELVVERPELVEFDRVEPATYKTLDNGHSVPDLCNVIFPDGTVRRNHKATEVLYVLVPGQIPHAPPITVTLDRAAHIKHLHIDGLDSGSTFFEGTTLESILRDVSEVLPDTAVSGNYDREAFNVDMGRDYGWENLVDIWEALEQGLVSEPSSHLIDTHHKDITRMNLQGTLEEKQAFVDYFNEVFGWSEVFLRVVREPDGGVIIPHLYGEPHTTSDVMVALSTRRSKSKYRPSVRYLHTITPGRAMGKHPIPGQHMVGANPRRLDMKSFRTSAFNWSHHLLIVPAPEDEQDILVD